MPGPKLSDAIMRIGVLICVRRWLGSEPCIWHGHHTMYHCYPGSMSPNARNPLLPPAPVSTAYGACSSWDKWTWAWLVAHLHVRGINSFSNEQRWQKLLKVSDQAASSTAPFAHLILHFFPSINPVLRVRGQPPSSVLPLLLSSVRLQCLYICIVSYIILN